MTVKTANKAEKSSWRGASNEERCRWMDDLVIVHPKFKKGIDTLSEKIESAQKTGRGAGVFLMGAAGSGKSTFIKYLENLHGELPDPLPLDKTLCPVVKFKIPKVCNQKQLMVEILRAMQDLIPDKGNYTELKIRVVKLFSECKVRLVLVDDLQDVPALRKNKGIQEIASCFRDLIDQTSAVFLMCGTEAAQVVIDGEVQLRRRVPCRLFLRYFDIKEDAQKPDFVRLMHELEKRIPLAEKSCITDPAVMERMFLATNGMLQYLIELIDLSWPIAKKADREHIVAEDLALAFGKLWGDVSYTSNPFDMTKKPRELTKEGEPFYDWK